MRAFVGVVLIFLLGAMFISLFYMSMDMNMADGMTDCPFMAHEEVICPMDLADHIGVWKSAFLAVMPTFLLLAVTGALLFVVSIAPNLLVPIRKSTSVPLRQLRERTYSFACRSLQELFSNGILHPKIF